MALSSRSRSSRSRSSRSRTRRRVIVRTGLAGTVALGAAWLTVLTVLTVPAVPADAATADLPDSFTWETSEVLVEPRPADGHDVVSVKDPTVVNLDGQWHVYATTADSDQNWSMVYFGGFENWSQAGAAEQFHLSDTAIGSGYRAAPQLFYFEPGDEWYLVYQTGLPSFSTLEHPSQPETLTAPRNFMDAYPPIVTENSGPDGYVVDHWVTCDETDCYLFFHNDNGYLFRARTTVGEFPNGFGDTVIVLHDDNKHNLFEASNVYRLAGTDEYLLLVEAIGQDGRRYFRSWTSSSLAAVGDEWVPLAATEDNPFAKSSNVTFADGVQAWTQDFSHGELLRDGYDQTLTVDPCQLRYLYQGLDPDASGDYALLPWRLGLLEQTNSNCVEQR